MKILITGGLGFAGVPLTKYLLSEGHSVSVIDKLLFNNQQKRRLKVKTLNILILIF